MATVSPGMHPEVIAASTSSTSKQNQHRDSRDHRQKQTINMSGPPGRRKYDTFNPSALPTANVGRGRIALDKDGKDQLEAQYEAWNKRLDEEVGNMAKGLQELVELSNIGTNPPSHDLTSLHLKLKTASLVRSACALRDTAHELRLALLLGDDVATAGRRDAEARRVEEEIEKLRKDVGRGVSLLVGGDGGADSTPTGGDKPTGGEGGVAPTEAPAQQEQTSTSPKKDASPTKPTEAMDVDDEDEDEFEEV